MQAEEMFEAGLAFVEVRTVCTTADLREALAGSVVGAVLRLEREAMSQADLHAVLEQWVSGGGRSLAVVVASPFLPAMRSVAMDFASLGVVVGAFSEPDLQAACQHVLREQQLAWTCALAALPRAVPPRTHPTARTSVHTPTGGAGRWPTRRTAAQG